MDFTFLEKKQIFGDNSLSIFEEIGEKCAITDFSILLGGYVSADYYIDNGTYSLEDRAGCYWTKTDDSDYDVVTVDLSGSDVIQFVTGREHGSRLAIKFSEISEFAMNGVTFSIEGIPIAEYGYYPQTAVLEDMQQELEHEYLYGNLRTTGNIYTTDSVKLDEQNIGFTPITHKEYEYKGKRYVRAKYINTCPFQLSNRKSYAYGDYVWIEVEPIKWLVDIDKNIAVSEKILFAGVQFNNKSDYITSNFPMTNIKRFIDNYFSKELFQNVMHSTKEMTTDELAKDEEEQKRRNPYGLTFDQVSEEDIIKGAIESGLSVFLHGRSSEGKSARVKQIDPDCVIIYLRNATPESLNGKSVYNSEKGEMIDVKPTWLKKLEEKCEKEPDKLHLVFFDEITNALPSIQGIAFNIVLDKEVNGIWKLPENARIVAAGNDMKDSLAANQIAEPLFNRFVHVYIETKVEKWLKWASENNIHPAIYSYIAYKKEAALRSEYNGETPNADPRKWEMASKMLYATNNPEMLRGLLGEDITRDFVEFCKQRVITLEDVINENYTERDIELLNTAGRYATTMGLSQVDEENLDKVREFVTKLGAEFCAIFDTLWIHGDEARLERIAEARLVKSRNV